MKGKEIITIILIASGLYIFYILYQRYKSTGTTNQEQFEAPQTMPENLVEGQLDHWVNAERQLANQEKITDTQPIANNITPVDPQEELVYDTTYNILVEAPKIPAYSSTQMLDELTTEIENKSSDPIQENTGGPTKTTSSMGTTTPTKSYTEEITKKVVEEFIPTKEMAEESMLPTESLHDIQHTVTTEQGTSIVRYSGR